MEQQIILSRGGTRISARELEVEIINVKRDIMRKRKNVNQKNDIQLSSLDEETIIRLKDWAESKE